MSDKDSDGDAAGTSTAEPEGSDLVCDECGKTFKSERGRNQHKQTTHSDGLYLLFFCHVCASLLNLNLTFFLQLHVESGGVLLKHKSRVRRRGQKRAKPKVQFQHLLRYFFLSFSDKL